MKVEPSRDIVSSEAKGMSYLSHSNDDENIQFIGHKLSKFSYTERLLSGIYLNFEVNKRSNYLFFNRIPLALRLPSIKHINKPESF